jgi:hypothetical protein
MRYKALLSVAIAMAVGASAPVRASIIDWTLQNVVFDDGTAATGIFSTDSSTGHLASFDITTMPGKLPGKEYVTGDSVYYNICSCWTNEFAIGQGSPYISLNFSDPLTSPGTNNLSLGTLSSYECSNCAVVRYIISGDAHGVVASRVPATPTLSSNMVDFGTVRAGTSNVTGKTTVTNTSTGSLVDNLNVTSATGLPGNVSVNGALPTGLGSGQSGDIGFRLDSTNPGVVGGSATLSFTSTSAADSLVLPTQQVSFTGTVTQLANGEFVLDSGVGSLTGGGTSFSLDLGSIAANTGSVTSDLGVVNDIANTVYAETLGGSFVGGTQNGYSFSGAPFSGLVGGLTDTGNLLTFDTTGLKDGVHTEKISFDGASSYTGLSDKNLSPIVLTITATIFGATAVPEPGTWTMMLLGFGGLGAMMRSRRGVTRAAA